jgi:sigma-E factor negative regulatory protein RseC
MIEENAIVIEQVGAQVRLEVVRRSACGICGQRRGCGNATWGKMLGHHEASLKVDNLIDAKVGDYVVVGIEEKAFLNATFLLYVVPLVALFFGAGLAQYFLKQDGYVILAAILSLIVGFYLVKKLTNLQSGRWAFFARFSQQPYAVLLRRSDAVPVACP